MQMKLLQEDIQTMALFEEMAKVKVIDYLKKDDECYFIVECRTIKDAIGEKGEKIKRIEKAFGMNIKVFKYSPQIREFAENILTVPLKTFEVSGKKVKLSVDIEDKPIAIGRGGRKIKALAEFLKRNFGIDDVKLM